MLFALLLYSYRFDAPADASGVLCHLEQKLNTNLAPGLEK